MSTDRWWWAQKAQQLQFTQLDIARRQAESWRSGLTGVTALLGAVLVIKGRGDVAGLATPYEVVLIALYGIAMTGLVTATFLAIQAAAGVPGDECLLTGEDLKQWTHNEVGRIRSMIRSASVLTVIGITALALGAGTAWLAPARQVAGPVIRIQSNHGSYCGKTIHFEEKRDSININELDGKYVIPVSVIVNIEATSSCDR